jgi:DNA polymerase-4
MERRIGCFNVPAFEIELARANNRRLRSWPAVLVAENSAAAILLEVSPEARNEGIHDAMKLWQARRTCPGLLVIMADTRRLSTGQKIIGQIFKRFSPACELANPGEFYLDLTGTARLFGDSVTTASRLKKELSETGIRGSMGVAANKLVSNVATRSSGNNGLSEVRPGNEQSFLSPLPVRWLPGVRRLFGPAWPQTATKMEDLCLTLNRDVAAVRAEQLEMVFGRRSRVLKQWSTGFDPSPVWGESGRPALEIFQTLEKDECDDDILLNVLFRIVERLCSGLRQQHRYLREIKLVLQYADRREITKTLSLFRPTRLESEIYPASEKLFLAVSRRVRIRRIGLTAIPTKEPIQFELFAATREASLASAPDALENQDEQKLVYHGCKQVH